METETKLASGIAEFELRAAPSVAPARGGTARVFVFYSLALLLTGIGGLLFADLLWRVGWSPARTVLLVLFSILFFLASVGCMHGIYGFALRRFGDRRRITASGEYRNRALAGTSTALVFPIYNENARQVCESVRALYRDLEATGELEHFDFYILSDSTHAANWIDEESCWSTTTRELDGFDRIFYRRRAENAGRKSGNIRDFLNRWGRQYRYFIVFDADSVMRAATVLDLVRLMEAHPAVGLIQTAPALANARSAFARFQQFASRLYGPVFQAGLNYWSQDASNYWGHNAIIRTEPFMQFCDLPELPGRKPFGGQILSHDFVEAALLRKENWAVWFAYDLEGSYEEGPPGIIENAQRDRRWCQGNLQHCMVLFARGFHGVSRLHLSLGILGYLAAPLWFVFMLTTTWLLWHRKATGLSDIAVAAFTPYLRLPLAQHALLVFGLSMLILFVPKVLSVLDLLWDERRRRAFGGWPRAAVSTVLETLFSTLHAPIQMLFHTRFVAMTLLGIEAHWNTQQRSAAGTRWRDAWRQHWAQTTIGLGWAVLTWRLDAPVFWWFLPVFAGLVLSVPLSVFTSSDRLGSFLRRAGLLLTPEETAPPAQFSAPDFLPTPEAANGPEALRRAIRDPYLNAIHVSLLRNRPPWPHEKATEAGKLGRQLLHRGPNSLTAAEQLTVASDPDIMAWLHREYWLHFEQMERGGGGME